MISSNILVNPGVNNLILARRQFVFALGPQINGAEIGTLDFRHILRMLQSLSHHDGLTKNEVTSSQTTVRQLMSQEEIFDVSCRTSGCRVVIEKVQCSVHVVDVGSLQAEVRTR